jgi:hypothetical protein
MLGLVLIYFIGKYFYKLAEEFGKNKWGFAILGVVSYYGGAFLGGIILGLISIVWDGFEVEYMSDMQLGLMAIPFGLLMCFGAYTLLKKIWTKNKKEEEVVSIDDIGKN